MTQTRRLFMAAAALAAFALPASAQTYPVRPITLIVPFAAGGPSDAIARLVGHSMSATLGQQVVIENVTGAGGTVGAARTAKADPDGYTLLIAHVALPASASLYKSLPYDTATAFEPLGLVNFGPMALATRKDYPAADAKALLAKLKEDGPKTTMAHAGIGSNAHLCGLLLQQAVGAKITEVAYRGTGPAMNDLMGGQVDLLCDQSTNAVPQIEARTVKGYAVTSAKRLDVLKGLPTLQEVGLPGFEFVIWHAMYAPKDTPAPVVAALNKALRIALADVTIRSRFAAVGTDVYPEAELTPEAHRARFLKEIATWRDVVAKSGVSVGN
ncbi:tripartite tricarboxylate transporter substrate-binding protein [uncultured Enterovirga sp.]|uniref:tripartite tricarboxylate transporter substrate-binding protein n=1 Tax=uncultured Enterovirga sp. TaxID=2026352 RepID=UPI0035CC3CB3